MFKTLVICCNEGENITEESREGATLYFLHKSLSEEEIELLIVSRRWYPKYSNDFSTGPKYQTKFKVSILIKKSPSQNITTHYGAQQTEKANTKL